MRERTNSPFTQAMADEYQRQIWPSIPENIKHQVDLAEKRTRQLIEDRREIKKHFAQDSNTAGQKNEELWADLLRSILPPECAVKLGGKIIQESGIAPRQIDLIILKPGFSSLFNLNGIYDSRAILHAFECKLTYTKNSLKETVAKVVDVKAALEDMHIYNPSYCPMPRYGLLATGIEVATVKDDTEIHEQIMSVHNNVHPYAMIDMVLIPDRIFSRTVREVDVFDEAKMIWGVTSTLQKSQSSSRLNNPLLGFMNYIFALLGELKPEYAKVAEFYAFHNNSMFTEYFPGKPINK